MSTEDAGWRCPVCAAPLAAEDRALKCPAGHSFDRAREGYVNLLLKPPGKAAGDDRAMLEARRRFLGGGYYRPLLEALVALIDEFTTEPPTTLLDAGCGEGSFPAHIAGARGIERAYAVDIAREAARMAAKAHPGLRVAVADIWARIPLPDDHIDLLMNQFAPRSPQEFARVLRPGGLLIITSPGPDHLAEARAALPSLPGMQSDKEEKIRAQFEETMAWGATRTLAYPITLGKNALHDLVMMMPAARHLTADDAARLREIDGMTLSASFRMMIFRAR